MKKSIISIFMAFALLFTGIISPLTTNYANALSDEVEPDKLVLDFSFFKLDYESDPDKYHEGAKKFFNDFMTIGKFLMDCDTSDVDKYAQCAKAFRLKDVNDCLNDESNLNQLIKYLDNYDGNTNTVLDGIDYFNYFIKNYEARFDQTVISQIDDIFKDAAECDKSQYNLVLKKYNKVIQIVDAFLNIVGEHKGASDKKAQAQKCIDSVMKSIDTKIFSSDVHKNNIGKILFSRNSIVAGKETASSFTKSFDANSNIYAIAYLSTSLQKIVPKASYYPDPNETCYAAAHVKIDGVDFSYGYIKFAVDVQEYQADKGYVTFELLPNAKNTKGDNLKEWYDYLFSKLKPGKHTISVEITVGETTVAGGDFDIDWKNADLKKISNNVSNCIKISDAYRASKAQVPGVFKVKSKTYKDKSLSDNNIKALLSNAYPDFKSLTKYLVNVGDNTSGWGIQKDEYKLPVAAHSTMNTWAIYTAKDGYCYIVEFFITKDYNYLSKTYGKPYVQTVSKTRIAAKNVK